MKACLSPHRDFNLASMAAQKTPVAKVLGKTERGEASRPSVDGAVKPQGPPLQPECALTHQVLQTASPPVARPYPRCCPQREVPFALFL